MIRILFLAVVFFASHAEAAVDFSGNWKGVGNYSYCARIEPNYWECHTPLEAGSCPMVQINVTQTPTALTVSQDFSLCPMSVRFQPPAINFWIVNGELIQNGVMSGTIGDTLKFSVDRCQFAPGCAYSTSEMLELTPNDDGSVNLQIHARGPNPGTTKLHYYGVQSQMIR